MSQASDRWNHNIRYRAVILDAIAADCRGALDVWIYTTVSCRCSRFRRRSRVACGSSQRCCPITGCVERMGDQCANIAKLVPLSGYQTPKDRQILDTVERMGRPARDEGCCQ
jgi:hypothetical protein